MLPGPASAVLPAVRQAWNLVARGVTGNPAIILLVAAGLATRLSLLSMSLDEVDAANFHNALKYGYDIDWLRPHAPGYPVYIFMGWVALHRKSYLHKKSGFCTKSRLLTRKPHQLAGLPCL